MNSMFNLSLGSGTSGLMNDVQMVLLTVFFMCFLSAAENTIKPDDGNKEAKYLKAFEIISRATDWSEEEDIPVGKAVWLDDRYGSIGYQNYTWAMGLRGKDHYGRRYVNALGTSECMASMVAPTMALTTCSCVLSWYTSYLANPMNATMFRPHPRRTINDVTAPYLFVHHTLHTGPSYFVDEDVRYYGIVNRPVKNHVCKGDISEFLLEVTIVLLEVETPVFINNIPAVMPSNIITETAEEVALSSNLTDLWHLTLLTYGTKLKLHNQIIIPRGRKPLLGQRLNLRDELITVRLIQATGENRAGEACDRVHFGFKYPGLECWKAFFSLPVCHVLAGSPIVTNDGISIYGIVMNEILCDEEIYTPRKTELGFLQVLRLGGEFQVTKYGDKEFRPSLVKDLLAFFKEESDRRDKLAEATANPQELFNYKPGQVAYDEDFAPKIIDGIKRRFPASHGVRISVLDGIFMSFIRLLFL